MGVAVATLVICLSAGALPEIASAREVPDSRVDQAASESRADLSAVPVALSRGFWSDLSEVGSYLSGASEELLAGRTPMPECHGKAEEMPSGGRISITFENGVLAWACVRSREDEYVTVELTNTYTAPLTVRTPSDTTLQYDQQSVSGGLMFEMGKAWGQAVIPVSERAQLVVPRDSLPVTIELSTDHEIVLSGILSTALGLAAEVGSIGGVQKLLNAGEMVDCMASGLRGDVFGTVPCVSAIGGLFGSKAALVVGLVYGALDFGPTAIGQLMQDWRGPSSITLRYEPGLGQRQEVTKDGVCAGIADCEQVDRADVDGDGRLDDVALVGEPDEYPSGPNTQITVRVLLADGTAVTREAALEGWYGDTAWHGATDFGQVPGEELVIGGTSGPHTKWYRVLTYRDGELVELPYPDSDPATADLFYATMWPIDAALSAYVGVQCETVDSTVVLRSVTTPGPPSEDSTYEGEATSWVLEGDQWRMTDSSELMYPDGSSASEIAGWQCGDLPRGYELREDASSSDDSGDSDTGAADSSDNSEGVNLDQAVGDYYRAAGAEEWAYTYNHLDSQTRSMFTEEEWSQKNQWFWDLNPTVYHILSIESDGESEGSVAEVELRITGEDGSSWTRTTYFVKEEGEWLHRFSEEETDLFMPDATFEEFVEAHTDASVRRNSSLGYLSPYEYEQAILEEATVA